MRSTFKILPILLFFVASLQADGRISEFHATRQEGSVLLEWATAYEQNLARFEIQRSNDQNNWIKIGDQKAFGHSPSKRYYSYVDNTFFKSSEANFYYRLVLVNQDGNRSVDSMIASVSGSSGFRHTWGSIKAMFR